VARASLTASVPRGVARRPIDLLWVAAVGILVALLYAPAWHLVPGFGLDPSWRLGVSWAFDLGYSWGSDIVFSYGPLGWTIDPMAFAPDQIVVALLIHVVAAVAALLIADLLAREQLELSRWPALGLAAVATALCMMAVNAPVVLALFGAVATLVRPRWTVLAITAICIGVLGHQKFTEAALAAGFAFLCALGGFGWRGAGALTIMAVGTWTGTWLLLGQDPGGLADHIVNSIATAIGYSQAQARPKPEIMWQHVVAVALVIFLIWQAFEAGRRQARRQRVCLLAATALASYVMVRAGFTRHDDGHLVLFLGYVAALGAALVLGTVRGQRRVIGVAAVAIALALQVWVTPGRDWLRPIDRTGSLTSLARSVSAVIDDDTSESLLRDARASLTELHGLTPEVIAAVQGDRVVVDPWDVSAAWAADVDWQPVPSFVPLNASSPSLDRLNAADLANEPRLVLQSLTAGSVDDRNPDWETPAYRRLLYCDYSEALSSHGWLVLRPSDQSRCGQSHEGETLETHAGEAIPVPVRPGAVTLATIELHLPLQERLLPLIGVPVIDTIDYGGRAWRWAFGERAEGILLNDPVDHPTLTGTPPEPYPTISVSAPATIRFEFMDVEP
jgi:hypothetical protein